MKTEPKIINAGSYDEPGYVIKGDKAFRINYDYDDCFDACVMEEMEDYLPSIHFSTSHRKYAIGQVEYEGRSFDSIMEGFFADLTGCRVDDVITQLEDVVAYLDAAGDEGRVLLSAMEFPEDPHAASTKMLQSLTPTPPTEAALVWRDKLDQLVGELQDLLEGVREFWLKDADYLRATTEGVGEFVWQLVYSLPDSNSNIYIKELQLYDHSGTCLTVSDLGSPTPCRWDSGIVGLVYGWLNEARKDLGLPEDSTIAEVREKVDEIVVSTVRTRDLEMNGCVLVVSSEGIDLTEVVIVDEALDLEAAKAKFEEDPEKFFEEFSDLVGDEYSMGGLLHEYTGDALNDYLQYL